MACVCTRRADAPGGTTLLARFIFNTLSPVQRAGAAAVSLVSGTWHGYVGLRHVRQENLLTFETPLFRYKEFARRDAFLTGVLEKIRAIPGVINAGACEMPSMSGDLATPSSSSSVGSRSTPLNRSS